MFFSYKILILAVSLSVLAVAACKGSTEPGGGLSYEQIDSIMDHGDMSFNYTVAVPGSYDENEAPVPLILALHFGGTVTSSYSKTFLNLLVLPALGETEAIMVAPNAPAAGAWTSQAAESAVMALVDRIRSEYNIDPDRILVTGFSLGAVGTWHFATERPDVFTAAIPVSGIPSYPVTLPSQDIPFYVIHSRQDEIFPYEEVEDYVSNYTAIDMDVTLSLVNGLSHYSTTAFVGPLSNAVTWLENKWD